MAKFSVYIQKLIGRLDIFSSNKYLHRWIKYDRKRK